MLSALCLKIEKMENITIKVFLQPRSSKNEIVGPYRDGIKVKVTAPPVEGKANKVLIQFLSKELGIPPSSIEILKGHHSREKTLRISGIKNLTDLMNSSNCLVPFDDSKSHPRGGQPFRRMG
jgi:uncharacterized protein (TIGR00251 family)